MPDGFVVGFAGAEVEGGVVGEGSLDGAGGLGVVGDELGDGAGLHVADVFPAGEVLFGVAFAGETDADEAFADGEDYAAVGVVPGVGFVLAHDGELDAVDVEELFEGEA